MNYQAAWEKLKYQLQQEDKNQSNNFIFLRINWSLSLEKMQKIETEMMNESLLKAGY